MAPHRTVKQLFHAFTDRCATVPLAVEYWDGDRRQYGPPSAGRGPCCTLRLKTPDAAKAALTGGSLGFGEAYAAGEIDIGGSLQELIRVCMNPAWERRRGALHQRFQHLWERFHRRWNTPSGARRAIAHHYDRGNEFYRHWLDDSMTYSCAYFRNPEMSLEMAQQAKYEHLCRKLRLTSGDRLVDIGCGWGGMLIYAARRHGITGVGYTLARNQYDYAREQARNTGVDDRVSFVLEDYRSARGSFDKFISIGMFEHVGKRYHPVFFDTVRKLLKPGGIGVLHTIGKDHEAPTDPWITTYIFPGGDLPSLAGMCGEMGLRALKVIDVENLRHHYHLTLQHWIRRFEAHLDDIRTTLADSGLTAAARETFLRRWRLYLNGSAANFLHGDLNLYQLTFTRGLVNDLPLTREHLYAGHN
ncbi:MAG: class I SAM-dependent methyltransferase [Deltaproteobacteria bacterium]|nr:class I SAM-dependent methyltransferase [Candidatus Anaeroferrophillacea bacterium]